MEEIKKEEPKKLSYEELSQAASELHQQYQKLSIEYRKAMEALNNKEFDYMSFFLTMLFKVMEHPNRYEDKFINWCSKNIQGMLLSFEQSMRQQEEPKSEEKKDEAK